MLCLCHLGFPPVPCSPLTFWKRGWMCMEKSGVYCASWGPQWWWFMHLKKRRLLPSVPWRRSSETQVQPPLTVLWTLNLRQGLDSLSSGYWLILTCSHQVSLCLLCAWWGAAWFLSLPWLRDVDRRMCWSTSWSALWLAPSLCLVSRAWALALRNCLPAQQFWRIRFSGH